MSEALKQQARTMVGDGKRPNRFFVTVSNQIQTKRGGFINGQDEEEEYRPREGAEIVSDTIAHYSDYQSALNRARDIELVGTPGRGWSAVQIEDRLTGMVYERGLLEVKSFEEIENDSSELLQRMSQAAQLRSWGVVKA